MSDIDLSFPLSDDEFAELDNFLLSDAVGPDCMDLAMADGLLTSISLAPVLIPVTTWLPVLWGGKEPKWTSAAQDEYFRSLLLRHERSILDCFAEAPEKFEPFTYAREENGEDIEVFDEWCIGFLAGVGLAQKAWAPLLDAPGMEDVANVLFRYGSEDGRRELAKTPPSAEQRAADFLTLCANVRAIHAFWQPYRQAALAGRTVRHAEPQAGRNDPCPCGSGKKFKKCCGA